MLDELLFGSAFMSGLLPAEGLGSHKVHNEKWSQFPVEVDEENRARRWAMPPSTNATWAIARTYGHLARLVRSFDAKRSAELLAIAEEAYLRAEAAPDVDYVAKDDGGGSYSDTGNDDDRYAATAELYLTTGAPRYRRAVMASRHYGRVGPFDWRDVATVGTLSLLSRPSDLPAEDIEAMKRRLIRWADTLSDRIEENGYPTPLLVDEYVWGSNGSVLNAMILIAVAYDITKERRYLKSMHRAMDYLLGVNGLRLSFITGYGDQPERDLHDRWAWGAYLKGTPFPPGWIAGGPNDRLINDHATPKQVPAALSYAPANSAPKAWCSKENAINWNAPLAWVAWYLRAHANELSNPEDRSP